MRTNGNDPQPLRAVIERFVQLHRMQHRLDEVELMQAWERCFGAFIARATRSIRLASDGTLTVRIDSGPLKEECAMAKSDIVTRLNADLGRRVVRTLVIH